MRMRRPNQARVRNLVLALLLPLLWIPGGGCTTTPEEPALEASLVNLRFTSATVFETVAEVEVRLENVSPDEVQVTGAAHRLTVNGINLGRGLSPDRLAVPRLAGVTQPVAFHLRNFSLARGLQELVQSRMLSYELDSTLYLAGSGGRGSRTVRLRKSGELDLNRVSGSGGPAVPAPSR